MTDDKHNILYISLWSSLVQAHYVVFLVLLGCFWRPCFSRSRSIAAVPPHYNKRSRFDFVQSCGVGVSNLTQRDSGVDFGRFWAISDSFRIKHGWSVVAGPWERADCWPHGLELQRLSGGSENFAKIALLFLDSRACGGMQSARYAIYCFANCSIVFSGRAGLIYRAGCWI